MCIRYLVFVMNASLQRAWSPILSAHRTALMLLNSPQSRAHTQWHTHSYQHQISDVPVFIFSMFIFRHKRISVIGYIVFRLKLLENKIHKWNVCMLIAMWSAIKQHVMIILFVCLFFFSFFFFLRLILLLLHFFLSH